MQEIHFTRSAIPGLLKRMQSHINPYLHVIPIDAISANMEDIDPMRLWQALASTALFMREMRRGQHYVCCVMMPSPKPRNGQMASPFCITAWVRPSEKQVIVHSPLSLREPLNQTAEGQVSASIPLSIYTILQAVFAPYHVLEDHTPQHAPKPLNPREANLWITAANLESYATHTPLKRGEALESSILHWKQLLGYPVTLHS